MKATIEIVKLDSLDVMTASEPCGVGYTPEIVPPCDIPGID